MRRVLVAAVFVASTTPAMAEAAGYAVFFTRYHYTTHAFEGVVLAQTSSGEMPVVTPLGVGTYLVDIPGVTPAPMKAGHLQITAQGEPAIGVYGWHCKTALWAPSTVGISAIVQCRDIAGALANAGFKAFYVSQATPDPDVAYAFADRPTTPTYAPSDVFSVNTRSNTKIRRASTGMYVVEFGGHRGDGGTVMLSPVGWDDHRCFVSTLRHYPSMTYAVVFCTEPDGTPADTQFNILYANGTLPAPAADFTWRGYVLHNDLTASFRYTPIATYQWSDLPGEVRISFLGTPPYFLTLPFASSGPLIPSFDVTFVTPFGAGSETVGCESSTAFGQGQITCWDASGATVNKRYMAQIFRIAAP